MFLLCSTRGVTTAGLFPISISQIHTNLYVTSALMVSSALRFSEEISCLTNTVCLLNQLDLLLSTIFNVWPLNPP
jgi:hypothetical protein